MASDEIAATGTSGETRVPDTHAGDGPGAGHDDESVAAADIPQVGHARDRTMYQTPPAAMREQIVVLLNYPKVGPLGANTIAINLGTLQPKVDPLLQELVKEGEVRQIEHAQHSQYSGEDIRREKTPADL